MRAFYERTCFQAIIIICTLMITGCQHPSMRIDGSFQDWKDVKILTTDPKGDANGAFDLTRIYASSQDSTLYLRFDTGSTLNIQNGPKSDGTLSIVIDLPDDRQLILDTRGRRAYLNDDLKKRIPWSRLKYLVGPTFAQNEFEIQLDLGMFGVKPGDSVRIQFDGSDQLDGPVEYTFSGYSSKPIRRTTSRFFDNDVRVVSLNTFFEGLSDHDRAEAFGRLLNFADGDIYCFQEEWKTEDIDKIMDRMMPLENARQWNIHKLNRNSTAIASKYPLKALPSKNNHYTAACVQIGAKRLYVISVHLSAMGYIGSRQDVSRIQQANDIMETIDDINNGKYNEGDLLTSKPGIVIVGDFNLVGSREPVDVMIDSKDGGLKSWLVPNLIGESIVTWGGTRLNVSFAPGKLDYILYSSKTLSPGNGFLLNTKLLNQAELKQLKLNADDSKASDHLLITTDYRLLY